MRTTSNIIAPDPAVTPSGAFKPWLKLTAGIGLILLFIFAVGPLFMKLPGFSSMAAFIEKENIRSTAIYYTDIAEFAEAETSLRYAFEFSDARTEQQRLDREHLDIWRIKQKFAGKEK